MTDTNTDQEKTALRVKLDDLSGLLKKLGNIFTQIESDKSVSLAEPQTIHRLFGLATLLESFESLEGKEGEVFVSFLKNLADAVQDIGSVPGWQKKYEEEEFTRILSTLRNLEEELKELMKIVITIDDRRKEANYEAFGGLLQKVMDAIQEKLYMIGRELK